MKVESPKLGRVAGDFSLVKIQDPKDFRSGLKLPHLEPIPLKAGNVVSSRSTPLKGDPNAKVRNFKESRKNEILNTIMANPSNVGSGDTQYQATGLFRANLLGLSETEEESDHKDEDIQNKIQGFIQRRKKNRADHEMHTRITKAFDKIEVLEKGVRSFDDTLLLAKGRLTDSGRRERLAALTESPRLTLPNICKSVEGSPSNTSNSSNLEKRKRISQLGREKAKLEERIENLSLRMNHIALNATGDRNLLKKKPSNLKLIGKTSSHDLDLQLPQPNHRLLARLQRREAKVNKELEDMRNNIQVMNVRAERAERRRMDSHRSKIRSAYNGDGNLTRLMAYDQNQGATKDLTDFIQAHGHTGGWNKMDHDIFLATYMKLKHKPSEVIRLVSAQCEGRRLQDVAGHLEWYEKYENLNAANKAYVREWQVKKRRESQQMYRMARQEAKAKIEGDKSRQEMIRASREAEREREKSVLNEWKKSKKAEIKKLEVESDILRDPDGPTRTTKLSQNLQKSKERLVKLLPPSHQLRRVLTKRMNVLGLTRDLKEKAIEENETNSEEENEHMSPLDPESLVDSSELDHSQATSSGVFSEAKEIRVATGSRNVRQETFIGGKGRSQVLTAAARLGDTETKLSFDEANNSSGLEESFSLSPVETSSASTPKGIAQGKRITKQTKSNPGFQPGLPMVTSTFPLAKGASKKLLEFYRSRDQEMMASKKLAIQRKKESLKNKAFLTTEETKKRISEINLPSHLSQMTLGIKLRQNIRKLEAVENSAREELRKSEKDKHRIPRVPTPKMFQTGPMLNSIPKLGTPAWRTKM